MFSQNKNTDDLTVKDSRKPAVLYCLSGLGADHRIFSKLNVPGVELIHLNWLIPRQSFETIEEYAKRLGEHIEDSQPVLIGVSFGGMMAVEIAKLIPVKAVILISSVKSVYELPAWLKLIGACRAYKLLPRGPLKSVPGIRLIQPMQNYFLGVENEEQLLIANEFRGSVDPLYLRWSIRQITRWKNDFLPEKVFHIHGARDRIFPLSKVKPTHVIENGGHFMVMSHASQINPIIAGICAELHLTV